MFSCPYYCNSFRQREVPAYLRLLHASPNSPAVDVYANGALIARNFRFKNFTEYMPLSPGNYRIRVYPAGTSSNILLDTTINIGSGQILTTAVIGLLPKISLKVILDPKLPMIRNKVMLRFVNLSPNVLKTDLAFQGGRVIFSGVNYPDATNYTMLNPGVYNFELRLPNTNKRILLVPNVRLTRNRFYTMYAVGLLDKTPTLQMLIALDGNSYIR